MRWMALAVLVAVGCSSADRQWIACDGDPGNCGDGYVCVPRAYNPGDTPPGYYCTRACTQNVDCEAVGVETNASVCAAAWAGPGAPLVCRLGVCETSDDCPEALACVPIGDGTFSVCDPG